MSPRPYRLGQRQVAVEQTRARILHAARELLMESQGFTSFSMDAVARQADVARMTVYHQFGSKVGLLEALCDSLAASGGMEEIASAFRLREPFTILDRYIEIFGRFWSVDRDVVRRLRALAALDPDFEKVIRARDERRWQGVQVITRLVRAAYPASSADESLEEIAATLLTLTSFETFDTLAGRARRLEDVVPVVQRLARASFLYQTGDEKR